MKTSNKILLAAVSIIGLTMLSILIFAKSSLIHIDGNTVVGDGNVIKVTHDITEINFFRTGGNYEVYLKKGAPQLIIETDENIHAFIRPDLNTVQYYYKNGQYHSNNEAVEKKRLDVDEFINIDLKPSAGVKVYLSTPNLELVDVKGHTKVKLEEQFTCDKFVAIAKGASELDLNLDTKNLEISASGHGYLKVKGHIEDTYINSRGDSELYIENLDAETVQIKSDGNAIVKIEGATKSAQYTSKGAPEVNAKGLSAEEVIVRAAGNSKIELNALSKLDVEATGAANISYTGSPEISQKLTENASLKIIEEEKK